MCTSRGLHRLNALCVCREGRRGTTSFSSYSPTTINPCVTQPGGKLLLGLPTLLTTHHVNDEGNTNAKQP